jgi:hypothetical protein
MNFLKSSWFSIGPPSLCRRKSWSLLSMNLREHVMLVTAESRHLRQMGGPVQYEGPSRARGPSYPTAGDPQNMPAAMSQRYRESRPLK